MVHCTKAHIDLSVRAGVHGCSWTVQASANSPKPVEFVTLGANIQAILIKVCHAHYPAILKNLIS